MVNISNDIAYDDLYPYKAGGFMIKRDPLHMGKKGPQDLREVIHCLEHAEHQGSALDEPEGSCRVTFSCTLIQTMIDVLKTCRPD